MLRVVATSGWTQGTRARARKTQTPTTNEPCYVATQAVALSAVLALWAGRSMETASSGTPILASNARAFARIMMMLRLEYSSTVVWLMLLPVRPALA